ncbi:MAG: DUF3267 domain-containing protein [Ruminococcaceae bacterium]|nr:DUF3267 domain-containing protein [Oscillospiraceae bacterium]
MENSLSLPEGYGKILEIDLQKNKKLMLLVNGIALVLMLALAALGAYIVPIDTFFDNEVWYMPLIKLAVMMGGYVAYIVLHELVHGIFMKHFSGVKPKYGFTLMYAYAGSEAYFNKQSYIIIALAPVVIWGAVLGVLCAVLPQGWFWVVYFIQIGNLSGAAGDFYVTLKFLKLPKDILVNDTGVAMTVYAKNN